MFKYPPRSLEWALTQIIMPSVYNRPFGNTKYDGQFMWIERPMREVEG